MDQPPARRRSPSRSSRAAARSWLALLGWTYRSSVNATDVCPRRADMVLGDSPRSASQVAPAWRRPCGVILGRPADAASRSSVRPSVVVDMSAPRRLGNTSLPGFHESPSAQRSRRSSCAVRCRRSMRQRATLPPLWAPPAVMAGGAFSLTTRRAVAPGTAQYPRGDRSGRGQSSSRYRAVPPLAGRSTRPSRGSPPSAVS